MATLDAELGHALAESAMLIGELAARTGFDRETIRYYEKIGLLNPPDRVRRDNNYKDYGPESLRHLTWIRVLKEHGFSLSEIRDLIPALAKADSCDGIPAVLETKLADLDAQIGRLQGYRQRLAGALARCRGERCSETDVIHEARPEHVLSE